MFNTKFAFVAACFVIASPSMSRAASRIVTCEFEQIRKGTQLDFTAALLSKCSSAVEIARGVDAEGEFAICADGVVDKAKVQEAFENAQKGTEVNLEIGHGSSPYGEADHVISASIDGNRVSFDRGDIYSIEDAKVFTE